MSGIDWNSIAVGVGMTAVAHPFTYVKVLVQLGHEPLAPILRRNMFFRKQLQYPSVFAYIKHISNQDGYIGMYRGLFPRICANVSTSLTYSLVGKSLKSEATRVSEDCTEIKKVCDHTTREMVARCSAVIVSQPFHVIAIRTMAEFVGQETIYTNIFTSTAEIYREEGILGFFSGLVPRLAGEIISIWLCNLLVHTFNTYILTENNELKDMRQYSHMVMGYIAQIVTYPLSVTSTVMATTGARITAANPPFMPVYKGWVVCLQDLHKTGASNRGSSMFFRKAVAHFNAASGVSPMPAPSM
ncbi:mitochondrial carrier homolog 2 [Ciona intestinalis]